MSTAALKPLARYSLACLVELHDEWQDRGSSPPTSSPGCGGPTAGRTNTVVSKRLSELAEARLIRPAGGTRMSELTRRPQTEWVPTAKGRRLIARSRVLEQQEGAA